MFSIAVWLSCIRKSNVLELITFDVKFEVAIGNDEAKNIKKKKKANKRR